MPVFIFHLFLNSEIRNIALKKPASQSSQPPGHLHSGLAVDGDEERITCSSTDIGTSEWWMVDLEARALILHVAVIPEYSEYHDRINPFNIRAGDNNAQGGKFNPFCAKDAILEYPLAKNFTCEPNTFARYVSINLDRNAPLVLCEVQVFGIYV